MKYYMPLKRRSSLCTHKDIQNRSFRSLEENPSLPLPGSGDFLKSLVCGSITPPVSASIITWSFPCVSVPVSPILIRTLVIGFEPNLIPG